jgi:hypothetical protein
LPRPGKSAFALVEVGAALWDASEAAGNQPEERFARLVAEQRKALGHEFAGAGAQAELDAVEVALAEAGRVVFDRDLLVRSAFTPEGLYAAAADALLTTLGLTEAARFSAPAVAYARAILTQGLRAAIEAGGLHDRIKAALDIEAARRLGNIDEAVCSEVPRELLESLVQRYGHENPDAPAADLGAFLKAKAEEWKALKRGSRRSRRRMRGSAMRWRRPRRRLGGRRSTRPRRCSPTRRSCRPSARSPRCASRPTCAWRGQAQRC